MSFLLGSLQIFWSSWKNRSPFTQSARSWVSSHSRSFASKMPFEQGAEHVWSHVGQRGDPKQSIDVGSASAIFWGRLAMGVHQSAVPGFGAEIAIVDVMDGISFRTLLNFLRKRRRTSSSREQSCPSFGPATVGISGVSWLAWWRCLTTWLHLERDGHHAKDGSASGEFWPTSPCFG